MNWHAPSCNQGSWARGYLHLTDLRNKLGYIWNNSLWDTQRPSAIAWRDLDHLASWVHAYDVLWPGMKDYYENLSDELKACWDLVLGAEHRKLRIHGTQHLTAAEDPDPTVKDVTDEVNRDGIDAVAHRYHAEEIPSTPPDEVAGDVAFDSDYTKQLDEIVESVDKSNELLREIKEAIKLGG